MLNRAGLARDVIVMGASAGGLHPLGALLSALPPAVPVIVAVVLHRSPFGPRRLASVLSRLSRQRVMEPEDGELIEPGQVYLAPCDMHLTATPRHWSVDRGVKEHSTRPAVDPLFRSAAAAFGSRVVGVLLSGAGHDGALGLIRIKTAGGLALVQMPEEAEHSSMPTSALRYDRVDAALPVEQLGPVLQRLAKGESIPMSSTASTSMGV